MSRQRSWARLALAPVLAVVILAGCSTIRQVTPLAKGEHRLGLGVGGPLFTNLGAPIPMPMLSVDYAYGITDRLTAGAAVHVTPIIFNLCGMGEVFATYGLMTQSGLIPAISVGVDTLLLSDFSTSFFAFPQVNAIASWRLNSVLSLYAGADVIVNFYPKTAGLPMDGEIAPGVPVGLLPSFPLGVQLSFGRFQLSAEARLIQPFSVSKYLIVHYVGLGGYGAVGVYVSASYLLGGSR